VCTRNEDSGVGGMYLVGIGRGGLVCVFTLRTTGRTQLDLIAWLGWILNDVKPPPPVVGRDYVSRAYSTAPRLRHLGVFDSTSEATARPKQCLPFPRVPVLTWFGDMR
jgi:hypothetical protein